MKQILCILIVLLGVGCKQSKPEQDTVTSSVKTMTDKTMDKDITKMEPVLKSKPADFLPKGYFVFEEIKGDLNKDGVADRVLIIKGTDKSRVVKDEYRGKLDRNRRGIIVLFNRQGGYEQVVRNDTCFSSENEDGGIYFAPELSISIKDNKMFVEYAHGRYGYWTYTFRYGNSDFELIGYDTSSSNGPVIDREISINFLTRTRIDKVNVNEEAESGEEVFETTRKKIESTRLIRLSEIKDFDELDLIGY